MMDDTEFRLNTIHKLGQINKLVAWLGKFDPHDVIDLIRRQHTKLFELEGERAKLLNKIDQQKLELAQRKTVMFRMGQAIDAARVQTITPYALLLSPYDARMLGFEQHKRSASAATFQGYPLFMANGIAGPLVVSRDAFNAISRQAPELSLRKV